MGRSIDEEDLERPWSRGGPKTIVEAESADEEDSREGVDWHSLAKTIMVNFNAAVANVLVSIPTTLALVLALNYHTPKGEDVSSTTALFTLMLGYIMSAITSGKTYAFKAFTAAQTFVLILQIARFGASSVPPTTLFTGLIILLATLLRFHKIFGHIPQSVIFGLQISVALGLIFNETSRVLGLPTNPIGRLDIVTISIHVWQHFDKIHLATISLFAVSTLLLFLGLKFRPALPWHVICFLVLFLIGYFTTVKGLKMTLIGEDWGATARFHNDFVKLFNDPVRSRFTKLDIARDPGFLINCVALAFITLVEAASLSKLVESHLKMRPDRKSEYLGIGITNMLGGTLGLLPVSLPISRNLLTLRAGANSFLHPVFCALLTVLFGYFLWTYMRYLPVVIVSVFNVSLAFFLLEINKIRFYWKNNKKYASVFTLIVLLSLFTNVVVAMIAGWIVFLIIYNQVNSEYSYSLGDIHKVKELVKLHEYSQEILREVPKEIPEEENLNREDLRRLVSSENRVVDVLDRIEKDGAVYELTGRMSFLFDKTHILNIRNLDKDVVLLSFQKIWRDDQEFMLDYRTFIEELSREPIVLYITGIPYKQVLEDPFLKDTWVSKMVHEGLLLFVD